MDLAAVAEQTKIKLSLLEGLERDDVSHWPRGIFRRSYVRAYASAIGLHPEPVIREFLERYPDPDEDIKTVLAVAGGPPGRPPMRLRFLVDTAIGALSGLRQSQPASGGPAPAARDDAEPADASDLAPAGPLRTEPEGETWVPDALEPMEPADASAGVLEACEEVDLFESRDVAIGAEVAPAAADDFPDAEIAPVHEPDFAALAHLCTRLACARDLHDVEPALEDAARAMDAVGLILWLSDGARQSLVPVLAAGYPDDLLARLPGVRREGDNAIATAFRTGETCVVYGCDAETGALAVPVLTGVGCAGVLAVELRDGAERRTSLQAFAAILAAQLATLVASVPRSEAVGA